MTNIATIVDGVSTDPEVETLRKDFPSLDQGRIITHEEIESSLREYKTKHGTGRYQRITSRWRKILMRDKGVVLGSARSIGFLVLNDDQMIDHGVSKMKSGVRQIGRGIRISVGAEEEKLSLSQKIVRDNLINWASSRWLPDLKSKQAEVRAKIRSVELNPQ